MNGDAPKSRMQIDLREQLPLKTCAGGELSSSMALRDRELNLPMRSCQRTRGTPVVRADFASNKSNLINSIKASLFEKC